MLFKIDENQKSYLTVVPHPSLMENLLYCLITHSTLHNTTIDDQFRRERFRPSLCLLYIRRCHTLFRHFRKGIIGVLDYIKVQDEIMEVQE